METYHSTLLTADNRSFTSTDSWKLVLPFYHSWNPSSKIFSYFCTLLTVEAYSTRLFLSHLESNHLFIDSLQYTFISYPQQGTCCIYSWESTIYLQPETYPFYYSIHTVDQNLPYNSTHSWRLRISFLPTARDLLLSSTPV